MELLGFEAHYNANATYGSLPSEVMSCVSAGSASTRHRLTAATLAMIRADNDGDTETAKVVFDAIANLAPQSRAERIAWLTSAAIYHASFGELERTPDYLRQLLEVSNDIAQPALRVHYVRRACFGLARYGDSSSVAGRLQQCLVVAEQLRLTNQQLFCLEELGLLSVRFGNAADSMIWITKARSLAASTNETLATAVEHELRIMLALDTQDEAYLPTFEFPHDVAEAFSRSSRGRQSLLACRILRDAIARQRRVQESDISELMALYDVMKNRSYQDVSVTALVAGLLDMAQANTAKHLLDEYLGRERRELHPPPRFLYRLAIALDFDACGRAAKDESVLSPMAR
jgi:hypothetical protein